MKLLYVHIVLCCVAGSYLVIKQIEGTCLFHCLLNIHRHYAKLYVLYVQNCFLHFKSLNHNRHMSFTMKYFIEKIQGHWGNSGAGADAGLVTATVLVHLVAGALPGRAHILLLLFLLVT